MTLPGEGEAALIDGVIVARVGGALVAYENVCPHAGQPISDRLGRLCVQERAFLVCLAHGASFRLADGALVGGPGHGGLTPAALPASISSA